MRNQPSRSSPGGLILHDLVRKIAHMPTLDREPILRDIERLRSYLGETEQQLQDCDERFLILADSSPLSIWITDAQGGNRYINQTYRDSIGVTIDEVHGYNWQQYLHPEDVSAYIEAYQQTVREQTEFRGEVRMRRADGTWRWMATYAMPRFARDGTFLGHVGSSMDITERMQAEEALKLALREVENEKNRLLAVMEALPIGVVIVDAQGGMTQANQEYKRIWGGSHPTPQSIVEYGAFKGWWSDTGELVRPEELAAAQAVQKGETIIGQLLEIQRFDGTHAFVLNSAVPIRDAQGQITGCAMVIMDITEQREHNIQIDIQHRLLDNRDEERQSLARDLHDGPVQDLSSLLFNIQIIKEALSDQEIQVELDDIAVRLKHSIQNLRETINEMRPPSLIRFGFAKALNVYLEEFRQNHPEIKLDSSLIADEGCLSEPARISLYRILHEALINTVKHAQANLITVALFCEDQHTTLEIHDNGDGFSIYENLGDYSLQGQYGLVGMKERAEAIGGSLKIDTLLGQGTTIRVVVPQE